MKLPADLAISKIGPESNELLANLFEYYLHDMAEWFKVEIGPDGRYSYDMASVWARGYDAYLARAGEAIAGFALIGSGSEWLGDVVAQDVHEFFVLRRFRRQGLGESMARQLWNRYPGEWLVRVLEANAPAVSFWRTAISNYAEGSHCEEQRVLQGRSWRFFRFASRSSKFLAKRVQSPAG